MKRRRPGYCRDCKGLGWRPCGRRGHDRARYTCRRCVPCTSCEGSGVVVVEHEDVARWRAAYAERFGVTPPDVPATVR